ncbi:nuclease-related domain-containing protein [Salibacterium lacus]|uniref:Nuclease-related domain-containing protein n=1 Tax=Salibacterium lacus TaxID=1898109 RepID=A0ABW5T594_9BACI
MKFQNIFQKKKKDARRIMMKEIEDDLQQLSYSIQYVGNVSVQGASGASSIDSMILSPCGIYIINQLTDSGHVQADMEDDIWYVNETREISNPFCKMEEWKQGVESSIPVQYHDYLISTAVFSSPSTFDTAPVWRKSSSSRILIHHKEMAEFIQRHMFISRFQQKRPLLDDETITMLHDTLLSYPAGQR